MAFPESSNGRIVTLIDSRTNPLPTQRPWSGGSTEKPATESLSKASSPANSVSRLDGWPATGAAPTSGAAPGGKGSSCSSPLFPFEEADPIEREPRDLWRGDRARGATETRRPPEDGEILAAVRRSVDPGCTTEGRGGIEAADKDHEGNHRSNSNKSQAARAHERTPSDGRCWIVG